MNRGGLRKDDDLTRSYEARAKRSYDELIAMGGRPSRPVQLQPSWNAIYRNGLIYLQNHRGECEATLSDDEDPMNHHWEKERAYFEKEIFFWHRFRLHQEKMLPFGRLDTELELDHTNMEIFKVLTRLRDWEGFGAFWQHENVDALKFEEASRSYLLEGIRSEALSEESPSSAEVHEKIRDGLLQFNHTQTNLECIKYWMNWVKDEWPKMVAEAVNIISKTPDLEPVLEAKFRKQTHATFRAIQNQGGQPSHAINPPHESMDVLHRILHWSSETAVYKKELFEWKRFLQWRRHERVDKPTTQRRGGQCPQLRSELEFLEEFEQFRRSRYDRALRWNNCRQRILRWYQEEAETPDADRSYYFLDSNLKKHVDIARSRKIESEQELADAAWQLEKSVQEHVRALSEHVSCSHSETWVKVQRGELLPTPPPSISEGSRASRSSASSCSDCSRSSRSPRSLRSSLSSKSSRSSQSSQSAESPSKDRNPRLQIRSAHRAERRSKKINARRLRIANTWQQAAPKISPGPQQVTIDDDIKMTDASEDPGAVEGAESQETDMTDAGAVGGTEIKDTDMTDPRDAFDYSTLFSSESLSRPSKKIEAKNSAISSGNGVTSRITRSASRSNHTVLGRIPKNVGKKPIKKAKTFTEHQTIVLLDAASSKSSALESPPFRRSDRLKESLASNGNDVGKKPTKKAKTFTEHQSITHINAASSNAVPPKSGPLRRSDRLKEKASASAVAPSSYPNSSSPSQPPEQTRPNRESVTIKSPRPSRQKKPTFQLDALEPLQDSAQKHSKQQANTIEQSRSRRQKKLEKRARSTARPD